MEKQKIIKYYNKCQIDYILVWNLRKSLAIHYGYTDAKAKTFERSLKRLNEVLAEMIVMKKSDIVLDAGCGVGGSSIFLAEHYGCKVTGISLSLKQVKYAKMYAQKNNVEGLTNFKVNDFLNTEFEDNSFDVVWAIESVCYASDKKDFIEEAFRILKPGGRLIVADGFATQKKLTKREQKRMRKWLDGWCLPSLSTVEYFDKMLLAKGFKNLSYKDITKNIIPSSRRLYLAAMFFIPFEKLFLLLKIRNKTQAANTTSAYLQYNLIQDSIWKYGIFYAEK